MRESIPVTGTQYDLVYKSNRTLISNEDGSGGQFGELIEKTTSEIDILISDESVPDTLGRIELKINIAGQFTFEVFPPLPDQEYTFHWNGRDTYGRGILSAKANIELCYVYGLVYYPTLQDFEASFSGDRGTGGSYQVGTSNRVGEPRVVKLCRNWERTLKGLRPMVNVNAANLGGSWSMNVHHGYDPLARTLYKGDGEIRTEDELELDLVLYGGAGINVNSLVVAPDGSIYIADESITRKVYRIDPNKQVTVVAGNGNFSYNGDNIPAVNAAIRPRDIVLGHGGSLYIADRNYRVRKVDRNGIITTVAGNGIQAHSTTIYHKRIATDTAFDPVAVAVRSDGSIYILNSISSGTGNVVRVHTNGVIELQENIGQTVQDIVVDNDSQDFYSTRCSLPTQSGASGPC